MYCLEKQARSEEELTSPRGNGSVSNIGHNSVPVPSPMQTHFEIGICIHIPQNDLTEMDKSLKLFLENRHSGKMLIGSVGFSLWQWFLNFSHYFHPDLGKVQSSY